MRSFSTSLNKRMVAFLALTLAASLGVSTLLCSEIEKSFIFESAKEEVESFSEAVQDNVREAMEEGRCNDTAIIIRTLASLKKFMMVRVLDERGKILASTKPDEMGRVVDIGKFSHTAGKKILLSGAEGEKSLETLALLHNETCKTCHGDRPGGLAYLNVDLSLAPIEAKLVSHARMQLVAGFAILFMVCGAMLLFFLRFIGRQIHDLSTKMSEVEAGNLDIEVPVKSWDELGRLGQSFNYMVKHLQSMRHREEVQKELLRSMNDDLRARISELNILYEATGAISRTLRFDDILRVALESVTRSLGFDRVVLTVFNETQDILTGKWALGIDEELVLQVAIPREELDGVLLQAMTRKEPILVQDTAAFPIIDRTGITGCWEFQSCGKRDCPVYGNLDLRCWMTKGTRCSQNMRDISLKERMSVCGNCEYFKQEVLKKSDIVNLLLFGSCSFIAIPLVVRDQVLGILLADKLHSERKEISRHEMRLLMTFMSHVSVAVENAVLYGGLERKIDLGQKQLEEINEQLRQKVEELSEIRSFNESIIQHLSGGIITCTREGTITFVNRAGGEFLGWDEAEILGKSIQEVLCGVDHCTTLFIKGGEGGFQGETEITKRSGEKVPVEIFLTPLKDKDGNPSGNTWVFRDISGKREIEARIRRMDKLASLGQLASGLAHEIKNPLAGIGSAIQVLSSHINLDDERKEVVKEILQQVRRLDGTIRNLLSFARASQPKVLPTDASEIVNSVIFLVTQKVKSHDIEVRMEFSEGLPKILVDPQQIQQALLNLVLNAIEVMPSGGDLTISLCEKSVATSSKKAQRYVSLSVCDTGAGIDERVIAQIFNPFYTTKPAGTGLGLSITQWIVEQHNGAIDVRSEPGKGACFTIDLPVSVPE